MASGPTGLPLLAPTSFTALFVQGQKLQGKFCFLRHLCSISHPLPIPGTQMNP